MSRRTRRILSAVCFMGLVLLLDDCVACHRKKPRAISTYTSRFLRPDWPERGNTTLPTRLALSFGRAPRRGLSVLVAPEIFAQLLFESGDDGQRAPGLASQESADGGLVDSAEFFDLLETPVVHRGLEAFDEFLNEAGLAGRFVGEATLGPGFAFGEVVLGLAVQLEQGVLAFGSLPGLVRHDHRQ